MSKNTEALVTIAIGSEYLTFYNDNFRESHERFAKKTGRALIVITDFIDGSDYGRKRHPAWQKLLIFKEPETAGYERLCWIDADIYITSHSADPFTNTNSESWYAVKNNIYNLDSYSKSDLDLYSFCPTINRPGYILNTGFFIVSRNKHAHLLDSIYSSYDDQPCYENGPLSYHFLNTTPGEELDKSFNLIVPHYFCVNELNDRNIFSLVKDNNFIHFCGGINENILRKVILFDQHEVFSMKHLILNLAYWMNKIIPGRVRVTT